MLRPPTWRLLVLRHGATRSVRQARFPCLEPPDRSPLSQADQRQLAALSRRLPTVDRILVGDRGPSLTTASLLGLSTVRHDTGLGTVDYGAWAGMTVGEVGRVHPDDARAWRSDRAAAPHGGEAIAEVRSRVAVSLSQLWQTDGTTLVVASGEVIRLAVMIACDLPDDHFWKLDVRPCALTEIDRYPVS